MPKRCLGTWMTGKTKEIVSDGYSPAETRVPLVIDDTLNQAQSPWKRSARTPRSADLQEALAVWRR